jgi:hypothetical protein
LFRDFNERIVTLKECADENLSEEVKRNWYEIKSFECRSDRLDKEISFLSGPLPRT